MTHAPRCPATLLWKKGLHHLQAFHGGISPSVKQLLIGEHLLNVRIHGNLDIGKPRTTSPCHIKYVDPSINEYFCGTCIKTKTDFFGNHWNWRPVAGCCNPFNDSAPVGITGCLKHFLHGVEV